MQRQEKAVEMQEIGRRLTGAKAAIVAEYRGLTVAQMTTLRAKIRAADGGLRVIKNRLAKRALTEVSGPDISALFVGPTALATSTTDPVPLAKVLVEFSGENELFKIKGGAVEGKIVSFAQLQALAKLPSREILMAQLLGVMNGTARGLVTALAGVSRGLVTVIKAIGDKK